MTNNRHHRTSVASFNIYSVYYICFIHYVSIASHGPTSINRSLQRNGEPGMQIMDRQAEIDRQADYK